ncbi:MAG: ExeA family protein [Gammaproteobacteria bacterium]
MYLNFFGLNKDPFKITPDPEFFFAGGNRGAVLEALGYAVAKGEGIVKVVGEVGSGKTMLCRMLERELPDNCDIIYLANPRLNADDVLFAIAHELHLELPMGASKVEALSVLQRFLLEKHAADRRVVMFIEEAQGIQIDTLEEIRMLSNLETTQEKLLQIVLFGQPELDQKLAAHEIRQLNERITYSFNLAPLNREEIRDYVYSRLRASGYRGNELFSKTAIKLLAKHSQGLLRRINVLADKALLAAFSQGAYKVDRKQLLMAINDSNFFTATPGWWRVSPAMLSLAVIIGIGVLALAYWRFSAPDLVSIAPPTPVTNNRQLGETIVVDKAREGQSEIFVASSLGEPRVLPVNDGVVDKKGEIADKNPLLVANVEKLRETPEARPERRYLAAGIQMFEALEFSTTVVTPASFAD